MSTRPNRYPLHDTSDVNSASLPTLFSLQGFPALSVADNTATNALLQSSGEWAGYNDQTLLRCDDLHNSSTAYRLSTVGLAYTTGAGLTDMVPSVLTGVYVIRGNVYHFDAPFTLDAGLNPISFTASMRTWIYCDAAGAVRIEIVALATAAAPVGTEFAVIAVDTDATNITAIVTSSSPAYELHFTGANVVVDTSFAVLGDFILVGNVSIGGTLGVTGAVTFGPAGLDMNSGSITQANNITCVSVTATQASAGSPGLTATNSLGPAISGVSTSAVTGAGVDGQSASATAGVTGSNNSTGPGVKGTGGTASAGVEGVATVAAQPGVKGTGAAAAGSHGVSGVAVNTASYGVSGTTSAAAATSGAGVRADALGDGVALSAVAVNGNAGRFESDTSSPSRAPIVVVGQDADASTVQAGSLAFNTARTKWRTHTGAQYESFHSSPRGYLFGLSSVSSGSNITTTGDIDDITITPEQVGSVVLVVTGSWCSATTEDNTTMTVLLKDITGGVTIATSQAFITIDRDGEVGATRQMPFVYRYPYTLPATGSRLFRCRLNFAGNVAAVAWNDVFLTIQGVY